MTVCGSSSHKRGQERGGCRDADRKTKGADGQPEYGWSAPFVQVSGKAHPRPGEPSQRPPRDVDTSWLPLIIFLVIVIPVIGLLVYLLLDEAFVLIDSGKLGLVIRRGKARN